MNAPAAMPVPASVRLIEPRPDRGGLRLAAGLLRFSTAGSVDDGKSTLIGRLLYDTKSIFQDQIEALERDSKRRGEDALNLALLTDGLRAEREQNITIDVAYRYFATPRRKFIIADTPGHAQYTRNMVTGASSAELAVILLDARKGVLTQSRRHTFISSLLGIRHFLIAVNKMDLVNWEEDVFRALAAEFTEFASKLDIKDIVFIPVSALHGDNIVERSRNMAWYQGSTLLHHLENVNVDVDRNLLDFRFPVQVVIRPHQDYRGFAGQIASGIIRPGEEVVVLPSNQASRVRSVERAGAAVAEAVAGDAVVLTLEDDIDISRGDMLVRRHNLPAMSPHLDAMLCWMAEAPLDLRQPYLLRLTTRTTRAFVSHVEYSIDVDTLHRRAGAGLAWNDIGRVRLTAAQPVFFDPFDHNPSTGSFILIDPFTHMTVAAGMIRGEARDLAIESAQPKPAVSPGAVWEPWNIPREERELRNRHQAAVLWFTGLSGSGKSTLARRLERLLFEAGCRTMLLDGDQLRHGLSGDLGFSPADRMENIRRAGEVARLFFEQGNIVLCSFVSPFRDDRQRARDLIAPGRFFEIYVDCSLEECRRRDSKGLYGSGAAQLTGVSQPYESPSAPEFVAPTDKCSAGELALQLLALLRERKLLPPGV